LKTSFYTAEAYDVAQTIVLVAVLHKVDRNLCVGVQKAWRGEVLTGL
jgi:hypothetical protein